MVTARRKAGHLFSVSLESLLFQMLHLSLGVSQDLDSLDLAW